MQNRNDSEPETEEKEMATYQGLRHSDGAGAQLVLKDDNILSPSPSQKMWNHSPDGFNWGYQGSGPAQLALALLLDATANPSLSVRLHQDFKREKVASWQDDWKINSEEILAWVEGRSND